MTSTIALIERLEWCAKDLGGGMFQYPGLLQSMDAMREAVTELTNLLQRVEKAEAALRELSMQSLSDLGQLQEAVERAEKAEAERDQWVVNSRENKMIAEERDRRHNEALKALEPFANEADNWMDEVPDDFKPALYDGNECIGIATFSAADLRAARNAMGERPE